VVIIVMGTAGAGKTTIGRALAAELRWPFIEGDDRHPAANVEKIRTGQALTDADRAPWLAALHATIARSVERREPLVMACSALKRRYRDRLRGDCRGVRFVFLKAARPELAKRLTSRPGHFAGISILDSQLATLEEPSLDEALTFDATLPLERIVAGIRQEFGV
jgi:gluconokinase